MVVLKVCPPLRSRRSRRSTSRSWRRCASSSSSPAPPCSTRPTPVRLLISYTAHRIKSAIREGERTRCASSSICETSQRIKMRLAPAPLGAVGSAHFFLSLLSLLFQDHSVGENKHMYSDFFNHHTRYLSLDETSSRRGLAFQRMRRCTASSALSYYPMHRAVLRQ